MRQRMGTDLERKRGRHPTPGGWSFGFTRGTADGGGPKSGMSRAHRIQSYEAEPQIGTPSSPHLPLRTGNERNVGGNRTDVCRARGPSFHRKGLESRKRCKEERGKTYTEPGPGHVQRATGPESPRPPPPTVGAWPWVAMAALASAGVLPASCTAAPSVVRRLRYGIPRRRAGGGAPNGWRGRSGVRTAVSFAVPVRTSDVAAERSYVASF